MVKAGKSEGNPNPKEIPKVHDIIYIHRKREYDFSKCPTMTYKQRIGELL
jgi:hypothetical protein